MIDKSFKYVYNLIRGFLKKTYLKKAVIFMMIYRLCVCVDETKKKSAYAFYNQQDFCVYRRVVESTEANPELEYVRIALIALEYFRKNMRNRYYTEHFSELLDEDRGIVLCQYKELVDAFSSYRNKGEPIPEKYAPLKEQFDIWSISFEYSDGGKLADATASLIG